MGMGGGGTGGQIGAHVHNNMAGQGGNLTDATLLSHQSVIHEFEKVFPVGSIFLWGGTRATLTDWALECDGSAVSRTTFSDLFDIVGTQFGIGDGSTTFNLPDLDGKFGRGAPDAVDSGDTGGADSVTLTASESGVANHIHVTSFGTGSTGSAGPKFNGTGANFPRVNTGNPDATAPADDAHENRPAYQEAIYVIRF